MNTGEGAENRLAVLASGREIVVLANDEELERVQDRSFAEGEIALIAGTNTDGELEVAFDNFGLWNKPASTPGRKSITRSTPTATARPAADAVVTSDTLNVRSGPGTNYAIVGALKKGDGVDIVGRSKDGKWARLSLPKINEAWASAQYLEMAIDFTEIAVAVAPTPPPQPKQPANNNLAWLEIENHIGRYITVQVNDKNFRVEGKVGDKPGRYQFTLQGVGRYRIAAQLPNGGSHNWDLYVEPTDGQVRQPPGVRRPRPDIPADVLLSESMAKPSTLNHRTFVDRGFKCLKTSENACIAPIWHCRSTILSRGAQATRPLVTRRAASSSLSRTGVLFEELTPANMVIVDIEGRVVEGTLGASTDTHSHCVIYRGRPDVNGVIHTHSNYATAFAAVGKPIPVCLTAIADEFGVEIPCAPYARIGGTGVGKRRSRTSALRRRF